MTDRRTAVAFAALASVTLALVACGADEEVPFATVSVRVDARDPFGARPPGPLQVALLWTTTSTIFASRSVTLPRDRNIVELPLSFPEPRPLGLFFAEFALVTNSIIVHVPRIAIYRDDDDSGDFTPWNLDEPPPDRIFAVNGQGTTAVAAVRNFEAELADLTAIDVNAYYELTNGIHTPFIRFAGLTSTLTPDALRAFGPPIVSMYFDDSEVPASDIRCVNTRRFEPAPMLMPISAVGTASRSASVRVDDRIDVESVCGLTTPDCVAVDISTTTPTIPPDLLTSGRRILTQCRQSASFESLVTLEAELLCKDCSCGWVERHRALVVRTSTTPDGWPCGEEVEFCTSTLPLFFVDESCAFEP